MCEDSAVRSEELRSSQVISFDLSDSTATLSGSVTAHMYNCSAKYFSCTKGSAKVHILANGSWTEFVIPSHGTTTIRIPFVANVDSTITYIVNWESGGSDGRATGSFTLYF